MIFPLKQINFTDPHDKGLAFASIDHWLGMTDGLTGFCRTAASSMNVLLGKCACLGSAPFAPFFELTSSP